MSEDAHARPTRDAPEPLYDVNIPTPTHAERARTLVAQILASLNHPNIAAICDFQRSKCEASVLASLDQSNIATIPGCIVVPEVFALVLELVEGETLADRLARGDLRGRSAESYAGSAPMLKESPRIWRDEPAPGDPSGASVIHSSSPAT